MELEKQVCSLEPSMRLRELGVPQESAFYWHRNVVGGFETDPDLWSAESTGEMSDKTHEAVCSAFTVAELGTLIGAATSENLMKAYGHVFNVPDTTAITPSGLQYCMTQPNIAAQMLIYLLENNLITL